MNYALLQAADKLALALKQVEQGRRNLRKSKSGPTGTTIHIWHKEHWTWFRAWPSSAQTCRRLWALCARKQAAISPKLRSIPSKESSS